MKNNFVKFTKNQQKFMKKSIVLVSIFAGIWTFFSIAATQPKNTNTIIPPQDSGINTIVCDIGDVLFKSSKWTYGLKMLPTFLYNPTLLYKLTQMNVKEAYFQFLNTIPAKSTEPVYNDNKALPLVIKDWMCGLQNPNQIRKKIRLSLQETDYSDAIKNLFNAMADLMFIPENFAASKEAITPMIDLLKPLKNAGYKLCILSNWDANTFKVVQKKYPEVFELFDPIVISGKEKLAKPDPDFFQRLIERGKINPEQAIFIDDEPHNIQRAETLGFKTIRHIDTSTTLKEFMARGLIKKCETI